MELTKKQSDMFIQFYKNRYWDTKEIPTINESSEKNEILIWKSFLSNILWSKANKIYKIRSRWRETVLEKVFNSLWMNYWPRILSD